MVANVLPLELFVFRTSPAMNTPLVSYRNPVVPLPETTKPTAPLVAPYKRFPAVHVTLPVVVTLT